MKKYRLKKEAVQFFRKDLATAVYDWVTWTKTYNVDEKAIEEVEPCFVSFGFETETGTSLKGWGNPESPINKRSEKGAHFHFTLHFPSMKYEEYDRFEKGKLTRNLMSRIQDVVNSFYESFNNNENGKEE